MPSLSAENFVIVAGPVVESVVYLLSLEYFKPKDSACTV